MIEIFHIGDRADILNFIIY